MPLEQLKKAQRVIGIKQVTKAINKDQVSCVFLGTDADESVTEPLKKLCTDKQITIDEAFTMEELGKTCSIEVGAAAVGVLRQRTC